MEKRAKIPDKIPYLTWKTFPNGYSATRIEMIDKTHPNYEGALELYLGLKNSPVLNGFSMRKKKVVSKKALKRSTPKKKTKKKIKD